MKKIKRWFKDFFNPEEFNNLDIAGIANALNDSSVRALWLGYCFEEVKRINFEIDKRLLFGTEISFIDLCARRKAFQDMLEYVLSARRQVQVGQAERPNPPSSIVNLDRVTV